MIEPESVKARIAEFLKVPRARLGDGAIPTDLVRESFLLVQLVIELQEQFNARLLQEDLRDVRTVQDLVGQIVSHEITE